MHIYINLYIYFKSLFYCSVIDIFSKTTLILLKKKKSQKCLYLQNCSPQGRMLIISENRKCGEGLPDGQQMNTV